MNSRKRSVEPLQRIGNVINDSIELRRETMESGVEEKKGRGTEEGKRREKADVGGG